MKKNEEEENPALSPKLKGRKHLKKKVVKKIELPKLQILPESPPVRVEDEYKIVASKSVLEFEKPSASGSHQRSKSGMEEESKVKLDSKI